VARLDDVGHGHGLGALGTRVVEDARRGEIGAQTPGRAAGEVAAVRRGGGALPLYADVAADLAADSLDVLTRRMGVAVRLEPGLEDGVRVFPQVNART